MRWSISILILQTSCVYSLILDEQTDSSVLQLLVKLEADVNTNKARLKEIEESCSCSGSPQNQIPAFMTTLDQSVNGCTAGQPLIFNTIKLNQGSGYDYRHGIFRAPVNGTYQLSTTLSSSPNNQGFHIAFVKNLASNHVGYLYADRAQDHWQERSTSLVIRLNAGDDVWLSCLSDSTIQGNHVGNAADYHSHFSGFLIAKE